LGYFQEILGHFFKSLGNF